ncbi:unnamed protein product [Didymodactylos carnosus]|uniref:MARVEL domain-containing protein n=1 Tax=Didymodactylos carnosus TaxID=1234261 RepID=A0A814JEA1_9BILA|nr:unnamed protein product [Didymodactylos carnosus]CAF3808604.1 unnamed protein product [Didymodactylos carnosus]
MSNVNIPSNYMASVPQQSLSGPSEDDKIDRIYLTSIRAILKFACMLFCFISFICLVTTLKCGANHTFLASVCWLVIVMQTLIVTSFLFRLKNKFPGVDFELLDFFATVHDAIYLLIASSITIHYCKFPGQIGGGVMGILAFFLIAGDAVVIFLARRDENINDNNNNTNINIVR